MRFSELKIYFIVIEKYKWGLGWYVNINIKSKSGLCNKFKQQIVKNRKNKNQRRMWNVGLFDDFYFHSFPSYAWHLAGRIIGVHKFLMEEAVTRKKSIRISTAPGSFIRTLSAIWSFFCLFFYAQVNKYWTFSCPGVLENTQWFESSQPSTALLISNSGLFSIVGQKVPEIFV